MNRISFCIIADGKEPDKLAAEVASIRALEIPDFEMLIAGEPPPMPGCELLLMPEDARAGRLGAMRNALCKASIGNVLVVADDDMLFHEDFYRGLLEYGDGFDVLNCRILNPDGTRFWDWAANGGPRGHSLMDYGEVDPWVYITGGLCIMRREVFEKVQWDGTLGFYQGEDIDFSERVKVAGFKIAFNPHSTVTHDDPRYTQVGNGVIRK